MHNKPVVVLDPHDLYGPLRQQVQVLIEQGFVRQAAADQLHWARTAAAAVATIEAALVDADARPLAQSSPEELLEAEP